MAAITNAVPMSGCIRIKHAALRPATSARGTTMARTLVPRWARLATRSAPKMASASFVQLGRLDPKLPHPQPTAGALRVWPPTSTAASIARVTTSSGIRSFRQVW